MASRHIHIHIGTSGWHYGHWVGPFYPKRMTSEQFLPFYAQRFRTVEINNTFYSLPREATLEHWRDATPKNFVFACKASRFITHMKKLGDPKRSITRFFDAIAILGKKLGPVLFQLPPRWRVNEARLQAFLEALPDRYRYAFEFRDATWFTDSVLASLERAGAAFCIYDLAGRPSPEYVTTDLVYLRLHGPGQPYQGRYSDAALRRWAKKIVNWSSEGREVYCYFDNDQQAYAARDAVRLTRLVEARTGMVRCRA